MTVCQTLLPTFFLQKLPISPSSTIHISTAGVALCEPRDLRPRQQLMGPRVASGPQLDKSDFFPRNV